MKKYISYIIVFSTIVVGVVFGVFYQVSSSEQQEEKINMQLLPGDQFIDSFNITEGAVLLDVRTPAEYASGHIKGAINVDFQDLNFKSEVQKLDKDLTYFVYCRSGNRSAQAVQQMRDAGFTKIIELEGGIISYPGLVNK